MRLIFLLVALTVFGALVLLWTSQVKQIASPQAPANINNLNMELDQTIQRTDDYKEQFEDVQQDINDAMEQIR